MQNWAGNVTYSAQGLLLPGSVEEAQELIAGTDSVRPLGTRHRSASSPTPPALCSRPSTSTASSSSARRRSPSKRAFATGSSAALCTTTASRWRTSRHCRTSPSAERSPRGRTARVSGTGSLVRRGLGARARRRGRLDPQAASWRRRLRRRRREPRRAGARGARLARRRARVPASPVRVREPSMANRRRDLDEILAGAYSVSLFTSWTEHGVDQVWVKTTDRARRASTYFGATPADGPRNPVPGAGWESTHGAAGHSRPFGRALAALPARLRPEPAARSSSPSTSSRGSTGSRSSASCVASARFSRHSC